MDTVLSPDQEMNPRLAAEARFDEAAARLGLDDGLCKVLRLPSKEITVNIPVQSGHRGFLETRRFAVVATSVR